MLRDGVATRGFVNGGTTSEAQWWDERECANRSRSTHRPPLYATEAPGLSQCDSAAEADVGGGGSDEDAGAAGTERE